MVRRKSTARANHDRKSLNSGSTCAKQKEKLLETYRRERAEEGKKKIIAIPQKIKGKPTDPVSLLPTEILGMILRHFPDIKSIIALERVSRLWGQVLEAICTPSWVAQYWGLDADWCRDSYKRIEGKTDWQKFKIEGIDALL
jgi:hypothetical protein